MTHELRPVPRSERSFRRSGMNQLQALQRTELSLSESLKRIADLDADDPQGAQLWPDWKWRRVNRQADNKENIAKKLAVVQAKIEDLAAAPKPKLVGKR